MELVNLDNMVPHQKSEFPQVETMQKREDFKDRDLPSERGLYENAKYMCTCKCVESASAENWGL